MRLPGRSAEQASLIRMNDMNGMNYKLIEIILCSYILAYQYCLTLGVFPLNVQTCTTYYKKKEEELCTKFIFLFVELLEKNVTTCI